MDWIAIRKEYESTEISLSDLAEKYGLKYPTVKSRKQREKWEKGASKKDASKGKKDASKDASKKTQDASLSKVSKREPKIKIVVNNREIELEENTELTEKQNLFCLYFVKYWNATKAYQKAYDCGYNTATVEGCRTLRKPSVRAEIDKMKKNIRDGIALEVMAVLQKYIDIAFADVTDFMEFGSEEEYVIAEGQRLKDENGEYLKRSVSYVSLKDHDKIDGSLISEVKEGKEGISIKLHDKMKALEVLTKYLDLLPDHHKRRIEDEKLKLEQAKFETDKLKASGGSGIDENIKKIQTLASLLNNPAPNRSIKDLEGNE